MPDNEIIIIVTRMSGQSNEFESYFGNSEKVYVTLNADYTASYYNNFVPDNAPLENIEVVYFDGMANNSYNIFENILTELCNSKKILLAFHPGVNNTLQKAKQELSLLENITAVDYSIGGDLLESIDPIAILGRAIGGNLNDKQVSDDALSEKIEAVRSFILKEINIKSEILHLFLSLDIDMQALKILYDEKINGKNAKNPREYLKEMYADNIDYVQKLKELQAKAKELSEIEGIDKERLGKLAGISNGNVCQFFKKLGDEKDDPDEFLGHFWGIDGINSFHDWYCALDSCLRGGKAYKA